MKFYMTLALLMITALSSNEPACEIDVSPMPKNIDRNLTSEEGGKDCMCGRGELITESNFATSFCTTNPFYNGGFKKAQKPDDCPTDVVHVRDTPPCKCGSLVSTIKGAKLGNVIPRYDDPLKPGLLCNKAGHIVELPACENDVWPMPYNIDRNLTSEEGGKDCMCYNERITEDEFKSYFCTKDTSGHSEKQPFSGKTCPENSKRTINLDERPCLCGESNAIIFRSEGSRICEDGEKKIVYECERNVVHVRDTLPCMCGKAQKSANVIATKDSTHWCNRDGHIVEPPLCQNDTVLTPRKDSSEEYYKDLSEKDRKDCMCGHVVITETDFDSHFCSGTGLVKTKYGTCKMSESTMEGETCLCGKVKITKEEYTKGYFCKTTIIKQKDVPQKFLSACGIKPNEMKKGEDCMCGNKKIFTEEHTQGYFCNPTMWGYGPPQKTMAPGKLRRKQ